MRTKWPPRHRQSKRKACYSASKHPCQRITDATAALKGDGASEAAARFSHLSPPGRPARASVRGAAHVRAAADADRCGSGLVGIGPEPGEYRLTQNCEETAIYLHSWSRWCGKLSSPAPSGLGVVSNGCSTAQVPRPHSAQ